MIIKVRGPTDSLTGYGEVSRQIVLSLTDLNSDIWLQPQNWGYCRAELPDYITLRMQAMQIPRNKYDITLFINVPQFFKNSAHPTLGITMSETDGIPKTWVEFCNKIDRILVPSPFNLETFEKSGVFTEKLKVVPLGVNAHVFTPSGSKYPLNLDDTLFTFLSLGEWVPRKGFDILIKAFIQEFSAADNVCLVLKTYSNSSRYDPTGNTIMREIHTLVRAQKKIKPPLIYLLPRAIPSIDIPSLYRRVDCFVQATRGEGWNMPIFEALACGIPVITTNWSSHRTYLDESRAYLIEIDGLEPVSPSGTPLDTIYRGFKWAKPNQEHLMQLMRAVYENYPAAREKACKGLEYVQENLSWNRTAQGILNICSELLRK